MSSSNSGMATGMAVGLSTGIAISSAKNRREKEKALAICRQDYQPTYCVEVCTEKILVDSQPVSHLKEVETFQYFNTCTNENVGGTFQENNLREGIVFLDITGLLVGLFLIGAVVNHLIQE